MQPSEGGGGVTDTRALLAQIREDLDRCVGQRVVVRANKGRRRVVVREGTLERTYPSLFVINLGPEQQNRRVSYTYSDLLTETVEVTVFEGVGREGRRVTVRRGAAAHPPAAVREQA